MVTVTAKEVKNLRERTGAGIVECKKALVETEGDLEKAIEFLRKEGIATAEKRAQKETKEGLIEAYIHPGSRLGVLLEVNCETDFVARTEEFKSLVRDLSMQVAAASPLYISKEEVPSKVIEKEKEIYRAQAVKEGKPEKILDQIVEGKLKKFYSQVCLLDQPFIKEEKKSITNLIKEEKAKLGENITVRRFVRFKLGE
ncbi:MAG: translation elongation factor Ts [Armatimonadetes bacterium CG07_land_8_20_14_0_80_40_9]|nr:MAG: translation elongation factor Ts [Armatimonadetes bacterium CG07_land_8_20_14_0_80_40_9]